jgi:UDP-glucose 4-epimerase
VRGERVLVTGGTGFVGSALLRRAVNAGCTVAALVRPASTPRWESSVCESVTVIPGSLENLSDLQVRERILEFRPTAIVHLAWNGVKNRDRNSVTQLDNMRHSVDLFTLGSAAGATQFVGLGSQAEYGPCSQRISVSQPTNPTTLYGAAKLSTYHTLKCLAQASNVSYAWLRLFSSYGPGDDPSWMIQYLIAALLRAERPSLTGCEQRWDYIFVDDVADAILSVVNAKAAGLFNLGSGTAYPLREVVERIRDLIDPRLELGIGEIPYREDQVMHLEADISDLRRAAGWQPQVSLQDGLSRTVEFARAQSK